MVSKAKIAANARYNVKKYDVVSFRVSKEEHINERIESAIAITGESKAAFILNAIMSRLDSIPSHDPMQPD